MNHSIYSADRATHLKIVVVALVCATAVAGVGIAARVATVNAATSATARLQGTSPIVRAGQPVTVTIRDDAPTVR
jgi:hypothetical protein